ncbi:serine/threonine protein kinase [Thermanaeromonas toyohensis ToBE]|uniref:non-specific serine/threonine protein kinase n=1 Tax=Thermanaeromonas toyohensis ToBE TaxID=698762 RepID=A0A1W1VN66_9FIRM|nr:Stk1 family PASTA domain-containing Ser/Thr kinase [Thermanaeromonas toyohensis]SMB94670.1 serine/threonine protein kinase [Thermanaeromonas toyohensis ToBE]
MIGKILEGRYEIKEALGGGGMAQVYRGEDRLLHRSVTIKILREQFASDKDFIARFQQEARSVAKLSHPNVVSIYDVGQEDGLYYLVMEYVEGRSLKEIIKERGHLSVREALDIALQICEALEHAHENGVIHRDVKPHNILITKHGRVKVTDFGIAQAMTEATLTYSGTLIGSVHYLAPEQARGEPTGVTVDIYALGVVLYEMVTGELPFQGDTPLAVALKHLQEEPRPPRELNPAIPPALERIILRALAKDPARRYPTAAALRADLRALRSVLEEDDFATRELPLLAQEKDPPAVARTRRRPRVWAWVLIILAFLGLAMAGLWAGFHYYLVVGETVVPSVEGLTEGEALERLAAAGLKGQVNARQNHPEVPPGRVISQEPRAGERIKRSRPVLLVVSLGPRMRQVPNVIGDPERIARTKLQNEKFIVIVDPQGVYHPTIAADSVVAQDPPAGTSRPEGSEVRITLSKGPEPKFVRTPNLIGQNLTEAQQRIKESGLELGTLTYQRNEEHYAGVIIGQDPQPGTSILQGSPVNLVVSQGPGPTRQEAVVTIPPSGDQKEHRIRIVVIDAKGTHEEYNDVQKPGEKIVAVVPYYGKGKLQVFKDDQMILERAVP